MRLVRLIYASRSARPIGMREMVTLLEHCRQHNHDQEITGMLAFSRDGFLQVLEGSGQRVNALYHRIAADPRHHQLALISYGEVVEREFPDWNMAALDVVGLGASRRAAALLKYGTSAVFDPYSMSATAALRLMVAWRSEVVPSSAGESRMPADAPQIA
jgi:hypothetical protein